jgi:hypothetical protein
MQAERVMKAEGLMQAAGQRHTWRSLDYRVVWL